MASASLIENIEIEQKNPSQIDRNAEFDKMVKEVKDKTSSAGSIRFGNFELTNDGLYYLPPNPANSDQARIWICTPFWPEAYLRDAEGKSHALLIKIHDGEKDHLWPMHRRLLGNWTELNQALLDFGMITPTNVNNQKHLQNFLMSVRPEKKLRFVDKAGWHGNQYIFPDGLVIGKGEENESVYPINEICPKGVKQRGTLSEWQEHVLPLCLNNSRLLFSIGVALSSIILKLIGEEGGGFNFKGRSSIGKTKCLKVSTSVFGSSDYKRSWKTTVNGLEGICSLYNDSLLPLDEFGQSDAKDVGEMAYMISQGMGKQRSDRTGAAREPKVWTVMVISTGEVGLVDHMKDGKKQVKAGQMVRFIDIPAEVTKGFGCFESIHNYRDGEEFANELDLMCSQYYGTLARAFVQAIVDTGIENVRRDLRFALEDFASDHARNSDGQVKRIARRFGSAYAVLFFAIKAGLLGTQMTDEMAKWATATCFFDWLNDRGTQGDMESYHLIDQVKGLLNEHADGKFMNAQESPDKHIRQTLWGYKKGARFFVFRKAFKENLCAGFDSRQAAKILIDEGLLCPGNDGKSSRSERIHAHFNKVDRFYVIDLDQEAKTEDLIC